MAKPKLRFPEFTDEWEETVLEKKAYIYDGTHQTPQYVSKGVKFVSVENIHDIYNTDKFISEEAYERYKIKPQVDDILMTRITAGIIGDTAIISKGEPLAYYVSLALIRKRGKTNTNFLAYNINSERFRHELHKRIIHVAFPKKINLGDIGKCKIAFPKEGEQEKIADFLSSVDNIIQVQEEEISTLEEQEKGIMQKLFNREVRFKADDGSAYPEWEEKSFDEIFNIIQNNTFSRDCLNDDTGEVLNIHYGDVLIKYGAFIDVSKEEVPHINDDIQLNKFDEKSFLRSGDIIIADTAEDMTVGKATEICGAIGKKILSGLHTIPCRPKIVFAPKYLGYYINSEKYHNQLMPLIQGIKVSSISKGNISKTVIAYPCMDEQQKIADCLSAYDEAIQIKKDKLEIWKEIKKGLLQQMFV